MIVPSQKLPIWATARQGLTPSTEKPCTSFDDGSIAKLTVLVAKLEDTNEDKTIKNWDEQSALDDDSIAWITATPTMPSLKFSIPGLPSSVSLSGKFAANYVRGNGARPNRSRPEDNVKIPTDGSFKTISGDTWNISSDYSNLPFFGGDATFSFKIKEGNDEKYAQTIKFRIGGKNPDAATAKSYATGIGGATYCYLDAMCRSESKDYNGQGSRYNQFLQIASYGNKKGLPLWGNDGGTTPGGYGIFQVTGTAASSTANIETEQIWNWKKNIDAGLAIVQSKRGIAVTWMNRQKNSSNANGVPVPDLTVQNVLFKESTTRTMLDAVTIKAYNGASSPPTSFTDPEGAVAGFVIDPYQSGHFCYWKNSANSWALSRYNNPNGGTPFNYVNRICLEVQP